MSTMKKVLSVALALVLCLAMCVPAFAADTKDPVDQIADAISGAGIDLGAITDMLSGLGDFDIAPSRAAISISARLPRCLAA